MDLSGITVAFLGAIFGVTALMGAIASLLTASPLSTTPTAPPMTGDWIVGVLPLYLKPLAKGLLSILSWVNSMFWYADTAMNVVSSSGKMRGGVPSAQCRMISMQYLCMVCSKIWRGSQRKINSHQRNLTKVPWSLEFKRKFYFLHFHAWTLQSV